MGIADLPMRKTAEWQAAVARVTGETINEEGEVVDGGNG